MRLRRFVTASALGALAAFLAFALAPSHRRRRARSRPPRPGWTLVKFVQPSRCAPAPASRACSTTSASSADSATRPSAARRSPARTRRSSRSRSSTAAATPCRRRPRPRGRRPAARAGSSRFSPRRAGRPDRSRFASRRSIPTVSALQPAQTGNFGETGIILNALGARVAAGPGDHRPASRSSSTATSTRSSTSRSLVSPQEIAVPASVKLQVRTPDGSVRGPYGPFTADAQGKFTTTLPASATAGITATAETNYKTTVAIEAVDASYDDPASGRWETKQAGSGALPLFVQPTTLLLENSFVSDVGWVKPGETYPFRLLVRNPTSSAGRERTRHRSGAGRHLVHARLAAGLDEHGDDLRRHDHVEPRHGRRQRPAARPPSGRSSSRRRRRRSARTRRSSGRTSPRRRRSTYDGGPTLTSTSHGPKVIPPKASYDTRALRRPAVRGRHRRLLRPQAPGRAHRRAAARDDQLRRTSPGSTFNLYQEMSYGQLFPHGSVPVRRHRHRRLGRPVEERPLQAAGCHFSDPSPGGACHGATLKNLHGHAGVPRADPQRLVPAAGQHRLLRRRHGQLRHRRSCRHRALVHRQRPAGRPARPSTTRRRSPTRRSTTPTTTPTRTASSTSSCSSSPASAATAPSQLERAARTTTSGRTRRASSSTTPTRPPGRRATSPTTSSRTSRAGRSATPTRRAPTMTTTDHGDYPVFVRVGPYNVNPETAIDKASVISHEYGHSLGLPDFYSDRQPRDLRRLEADGDRQVAEHGRLRQAGARLDRPARARSPARRRRQRLDGHEDEHAPDRLGAAGRHAVHAHRRAA